MIRRFWQTIMVLLATSKICKRIMQSNRSTTTLAARYVGGKTAEEAVECALGLKNQGISTSLFYLGEYVDTEELVKENLNAKRSIIPLLAQNNLDIHISIDPTQVGSQLSWEQGAQNVNEIAKILTDAVHHPGLHCVMLDMEDFSVNEATIALYDHLKKQKYHVAITLQAYLRKTFNDMQKLIDDGAKVRLVKGAFPAGSEIAYVRTEEIKENYKKLINLMFSERARETGFYPIIATHDHLLHDYAVQKARENNWKQGSYEFEMLYGARDDVARNLALKGETIRLYLPFGKDWWPYAVRRIGENPGAMMLLFRSLFNK